MKQKIANWILGKSPAQQDRGRLEAFGKSFVEGFVAGVEDAEDNPAALQQFGDSKAYQWLSRVYRSSIYYSSKE